MYCNTFCNSHNIKTYYNTLVYKFQVKLFKGYRPCRRPLSKEGVKKRGAVQAPATLNKRFVTLYKRVCNAEQACVQRWTSVLERCTSVFGTLYKRIGTLHKRVCNAEQATR